MILNFTISEHEALAFSEEYYRDSPSYQKIRTRTRWSGPLMLFSVMVLFIYNFGLSPAPIAIFSVGMVAWFLFYPKRFDASVRRYTKKQMGESSYTKMFGNYEITVDDEQLISDGPTGQSHYNWDAVDRIKITDDFLFVFLSGPVGFPISIDQIGVDVAQTAYTKMTEMVANAKS